MNQISLPAVQFFPRFAVVVILLALTWLLARFTKHLVLRTTIECRSQPNGHKKISEIIANTSFWAIWVLMLPFIINAAGFSSHWLSALQHFEAQFLVNWPIWMVLSLLLAGIAYLFREVPKFFMQLKGTLDPSQKNLQS